MPVGMGGVGHAGAAGGAAADDELHRRELCLGWIYEFFARHRMEEAQEGAFAAPLVRRLFLSRAAQRAGGSDAVEAASEDAHRMGLRCGGGDGASPFCARPRRPTTPRMPLPLGSLRCAPTWLTRRFHPGPAAPMHACFAPTCSADQGRREKIPRLARRAAAILGPDRNNTGTPRKRRGACPSPR